MTTNAKLTEIMQGNMNDNFLVFMLNFNFGFFTVKTNA